MTKRAAYHMEARLAAFLRTKAGITLKLELDPQDIPPELLSAPVGQLFMMALSELGDHQSEHADKGDGDRAVQLAGILCRTPEFWRYLTENYDSDGWPMVRDEKEAGEVLKGLTKVRSRAEYRDDEKARARFRKLQAKYEAWLERSESKGDL